jgi:hypothetical protein
MIGNVRDMRVPPTHDHPDFLPPTFLAEHLAVYFATTQHKQRTARIEARKCPQDHIQSSNVQKGPASSPPSNHILIA